MSDDEAPTHAELIDLSGLTLADLDSLDESALGHALRHVLAGADEPGDAIAAFHAFI